MRGQLRELFAVVEVVGEAELGIGDVVDLHHLRREPAAPFAQIDALIQVQPNSPYFHELKGQALLEAGRGREAVAPLRRAMALAPNPILIQVMLGQALLASNDQQVVDEAISHLKAALARDNDITDGHAQLAIAYGRKGDLAQAELASAQAAFSRGDFPTARQLAARAKEHAGVCQQSAPSGF